MRQSHSTRTSAIAALAATALFTIAPAARPADAAAPSDTDEDDRDDKEAASALVARLRQATPMLDASGEPMRKRDNNVTLAVFTLLVGDVELTYARSLAANIEWWITGYYTNLGIGLLSIPVEGYGGWTGVAISQRTFAGAFLRVGAGGGDARSDDVAYVATGAVGGIAVAGYRWRGTSGLSVGLGGGAAYTVMTGSLPTSPNSVPIVNAGLQPKLLFDLGYAF